MSEIRTEPGKWLLAEYARTPGDPKWYPGLGLENTILAIEAEAAEIGARGQREVLDTVRGWLVDPEWPQFGPGIGSGPLDPGRMAARAVVRQVLDVLAAWEWKEEAPHD